MDSFRAPKRALRSNTEFKPLLVSLLPRPSKPTAASASLREIIDPSCKLEPNSDELIAENVNFVPTPAQSALPPVKKRRLSPPANHHFGEDELRAKIVFDGVCLKRPFRALQAVEAFRKFIVSSLLLPEHSLPNVVDSTGEPRPATPDPSVTISQPQLESDFSKKHSLDIIVAEDNPINQKLITRLLSKLGYTPRVASNGAEVIEFLEQKRCDVILMDVMMPVLDGIAATRSILEKCQSSETEPPFIIALTASAMKSEEQKCISAGMHRFIAKPIKLALLLKYLQQAHARKLTLERSSESGGLNLVLSKMDLDDFKIEHQ
eukprot:TRINITY_DN62988_c0_g1_i1.p1 TRINITY_DN62988_c0_g1~~TRINITY_DN62988_c0_g1_i1.p1  ORF type:complete len:320 (+),score=67.83 TRINITY_DN62988_c0_g1_i1:238-1197(+)